MENIILIAVIILIIAAAAFYIYRSKKRGQHCIGCPYSEGCKSCGHCGGESKEK